MQICIINKNTRKCTNIFDIEDVSQWEDQGDLIRATRDDGFVGWILQEDNTWFDPDAPPPPVPPTSDEKWQEIRFVRDKLLRDTDFIMLPYSPYTEQEKQAWATYRQALRDLPDTFSNPDDVIWPIAP